MPGNLPRIAPTRRTLSPAPETAAPAGSALLLLALVLLSFAGASVLMAGTHGSPASPAAGPAAEAARSAPSAAYTFPTPIHHVYTIFLENNELSTVQSQGPYEMQLAQKYAFASHYYAVCHYSVANYLSVTSGKPWQCGTDNYYTYTTENIGDLAQKAGLSWNGFMESMPSACDTSSATAYTVHHNPFIDYTDIVGNSSLCNAHDVSFSSWYGDVTNGTLPAYAFFAPNRSNDAHDTNVSYADSWLKGWLAPYLNDSWFNSTVWFIVYDEGSTNVGYNGMWGGHVYMTAVSPWVRMNSTFTNDTTHYDLLSTTEWLLGLGGTGNNDSSSLYPPMTGLFNFSTPPPPAKYAVGGSVVANATGNPIAGATVSVTGGPSTTTDAQGNWSVSLPNGSYYASAQASGFSSETVAFTVAGGAVRVNFWLLAATGGNATYPLGGTVSSAASSTGLAGATVSIASGPSTTTNAQGQYAFQLTNGSYRLTVWAAGFGAQSLTVTVAGAGVTQNFSLATFTFALSATVSSSTTHNPIAGASVRLGSTLLATTGADGRFTLLLPNGSYPLVVSASGYVSANLSEQIRNASITLQVDLAPTSTGGSAYTVRIVIAPSSPAPVTGEMLEFSAVVNGTTATLSYSWLFGDGGSSTAASPQHSYAAAGTYPVSLTTRAPGGAGAEANATVVVTKAPGTPASESPPNGVGVFFSGLGSALLFSVWGWLALALLALLVGEVVYLRRLRRPPTDPEEAGPPPRSGRRVR